MATYREVYENYLSNMQKIASTLTHSSENIRLFEMAEEMKKLKLISGYKLMDYIPNQDRSLRLNKYKNNYYNNIFEEKSLNTYLIRL